LSDPVGFFTDTTLCIGCKACEVACKQWNGLPEDGLQLSGASYDNTLQLSANTWRHVAFVESFPSFSGAVPSLTAPGSWLLMSDVCKHCQRAGCLDACPTGAIVRTEFDQVFVQPDICNGCGYCVPACPFGVIQVEHDNGLAQKCTLCYDRLKDGLEPACAKSCPTDSIQFGRLPELKLRAEQRVEELRARGVEGAYVYGGEEIVGGLNASFLLLAEPESYNLPRRPKLGTDNVLPASLTAAATVLLGAAAMAITFIGGRKSSPLPLGEG
jgi:formate dehydrogenase iron-sulfur subunit